MLSYKEHQPRPGTVLGTRVHMSGVCMGLERGLWNAQILLANQPPTSRVPKGAVHARDDDKWETKEPLYHSWGDGCGHIWKVESSMQCSSAKQTAGPKV